MTTSELTYASIHTRLRTARARVDVYVRMCLCVHLSSLHAYYGVHLHFRLPLPVSFVNLEPISLADQVLPKQRATQFLTLQIEQRHKAAWMCEAQKERVAWAKSQIDENPGLRSLPILPLKLGSSSPRTRRSLPLFGRQPATGGQRRMTEIGVFHQVRRGGEVGVI